MSRSETKRDEDRNDRERDGQHCNSSAKQLAVNGVAVLSIRRARW